MDLLFFLITFINSLVIYLNGSTIGKLFKLMGWEKCTNFFFVNRRKGLEYRSQFCEPVGAWFSQLGNLHTVQHMWTYP